MSTPTSLKNPIETNISNLINSTKVFLKSLTRWTQQLETQKSISNYYVQLGTDFRIVVKQFTHLGIEMSDVRNVPKELRPILEKALKEKPSNESLDKYWPSIKGIIEDLLNTLKFKRLLLKKLKQDDISDSVNKSLNPRQLTGSSGSLEALDLKKGSSNSNDLESNQSPSPEKPPSPIFKSASGENSANDLSSLSYKNGTKDPETLPAVDYSPNDSADTSTSKLDAESEMKKKKLSNFLSMSGFGDDSESSESEEFFDDYEDEEEEDILTSKQMLNALKTDNKIERRASKRYSAYHLAKGNVTTTGNISDTSKLPALPTSDQLSVEKMNYSLDVSSSEKPTENQNDHKPTESSNKFETADIGKTTLTKDTDLLVEAVNPIESTNTKPVTSHGENNNEETIKASSPAASIISSNKLLNKLKDKSEKAAKGDKDLIKNNKSVDIPVEANTKTVVFLKYQKRILKRQFEKVNIETVITEFNRAFKTNFSINDNDLLFKISDPSFSMFYELENINALEKEIQNGSGFEIVHETSFTEHEDKFIKLEKKLEALMDNYEQRIKDEINQKVISSGSPEPTAANKDSSKTNKETLVLKKALVKLDKEHKDTMSEMKQKLELLEKELKEKNDELKEIQKAKDEKLVAAASDEGDDSKYVNEVSNKISTDGDMILNKIDDLQDVIEILRKDVAIRGVKPKESNLDKINKTLSDTHKELEEFENYLKIQKPELKTKWEKQLVKICDQQQMLTLQEDLVIDLKIDLEKCKETMDLVIMCNDERLKLKSKNNADGDGKMKVILPLTKPGQMQGVRDQLLQDIQLLKPDHQSRIDAIEKHERFNEINK